MGKPFWNFINVVTWKMSIIIIHASSNQESWYFWISLANVWILSRAITNFEISKYQSLDTKVEWKLQRNDLQEKCIDRSLSLKFLDPSTVTRCLSRLHRRTETDVTRSHRAIIFQLPLQHLHTYYHSPLLFILCISSNEQPAVRSFHRAVARVVNAVRRFLNAISIDIRVFHPAAEQCRSHSYRYHRP